MKKYRHPQLTHDKTDGILNFMDYKNPKHKVFYGLIIAFLVVICLIAIFPIAWLLISAFKPVTQFNDPTSAILPTTWEFKNITRLFGDVGFGKYYVNTLIVVILAIIFSIVFNGLMAYVTGVLKPKGYKILHYAIFAAYMIPGILSIVPLYQMIIDSYNALGVSKNSPIHYITVTLCFGSNAYYYMLLKDYFEKIPESLLEAARIDGLGEFKIFYKVIIPLSKPIIGVVAIFTMTAAYSDFLLPYLILGQYAGDSYSTLMVKIFEMQNSNTVFTTPELLTAILFSIIPQLIMFIIFQKQIMNSNVNAGMKE